LGQGFEGLERPIQDFAHDPVLCCLWIEKVGIGCAFRPLIVPEVYALKSKGDRGKIGQNR
ncbi:MAG: hypothetical protein KAI73_04910, partial [Rhodospirillaceae bacterium]|nr:hypothetical protein [Rhodospirillaceae bacterium]